MLKKTMLFAGLAALLSQPALAQEKAEITVQYVAWMDGLFQALKPAFEASHPEYTLIYLPPYASYDDGLQQVLRQSISDQLPDVSNQSLNHQRTIIDRDLALDLTPFLAAEPDAQAEGFEGPIIDIASKDGKSYGLATAFSVPVAYYNMDLVKQAGGDADHLPKTWSEMLELARKIEALGNGIEGIYTTTDQEWIFQSLVYGSGGTMADTDGKAVLFDKQPGSQAFTIIQDLLDGGMPATTNKNATQLFYAGQLGIYLQSSSDIKKHIESIGGRFELRTGDFPRNDAKGTLVAGGNVNMILAKDPARQKAAWEFARFVSSIEGGKIIVENSGYIAPNAMVATQLADFYAADLNRSAALSALPRLGPWYAFAGEHDLRIHAAIGDVLQQLTAGQISPDAARTQAAEAVTKLLN